MMAMGTIAGPYIQFGVVVIVLVFMLVMLWPRIEIIVKGVRKMRDNKTTRVTKVVDVETELVKK